MGVNSDVGQLVKHKNCYFWELKEELKRTEKNLKELNFSKAIKIVLFETYLKTKKNQ